MPKYLEIGEETPQWEWNNGSRWQKIETNAANQIEAAYQKNPSGSVQVKKKKKKIKKKKKRFI